MPNPQADFFHRKIKDLRKAKTLRQARFGDLENKCSVHKWEARHRCCAALRIL
jgi:DNA-binding transcriptional regulator YiaG